MYFEIPSDDSFVSSSFSSATQRGVGGRSGPQRHAAPAERTLDLLLQLAVATLHLGRPLHIWILLTIEVALRLARCGRLGPLSLLGGARHFCALADPMADRLLRAVQHIQNTLTEPKDRGWYYLDDSHQVQGENSVRLARAST